MKTPETDNLVVDHLYDELTDAQREAFAATLESDADAAQEAQSYATLLKLYREETEELTPSVAATERLLREAERAHLSIWSRLFGDLLPRMVMRPAVGFAMVAVLLIGGGVFYVLSQGPGDGRTSEPAASASKADRTVVSAPEASPRSGEGRTVLAEKATGAAGPASRAENDGARELQDKSAPRGAIAGLTKGNRFDYKNSKQGALAANDDGTGVAKEQQNVRRRLSRRPAKAGKKAYFSLGGRAGGRVAPSASQPVAKKPSPAPPQAADALRGVKQKVTTKTRTVDQDSERKKLSPPALHNRARKNLAKGKVAVACGMFGSLVRGHRGYSRRADALLGWARCEMARGSYSRAAQLVRQLVKEYPKWQKTGATMLAQIKRLQSRAALRAQRVRRVKRRAAPRARPRPARQAPTSR